MADSEKTLLIKLKIAADGTPAIAGVGKELGGIANQASALEARMGSLGTAVRAFIGAWSLKEVGGFFVGMIRQGVEFNAQMETSKLGIAALVSGMSQITSTQRGVLQGQDKWNAALQISGQLQQQARIAALQTKAEYTDIIKLLQVGLGPMLSAGIADTSKIIKLVQAVAQTGGALGIPGEQMPSEMRALMRGERGPDNQLANILLADVTPEKFKQLRDAGQLYDFLIAKMGAFVKAGLESQNTFDTAMSNLKDAIHQALGEATQGTTSKLTQTIKDLTDQIVTFDAQGKATFNPQFVKGVEDVAVAFGKVAEAVAKIAAQDVPPALALIARMLNPNVSTLNGRSALMMAGSGAILGGAVGMPVLGAGLGYALGNTSLTNYTISHGAERPMETPDHRDPVALFNQLVMLLHDDLSVRLKAGPGAADLGARVRGLGPAEGSALAASFFGSNAADADKIRLLASVLNTQGMRSAFGGPGAAQAFAAALAQLGAPTTKPDLTMSGNPTGGTPMTDAMRRRIDNLKQDWDLLFQKDARDSAAAGDPLAQALAKIEDERAQRLGKLEDQQREFGKVLSGEFFKNTRGKINTESDSDAMQAQFAFAASKGSGDRWAATWNKWSADAKQAKEITLSTQRELEDGRINLTQNSLQRELQQKLAANARMVEDAKEKYGEQTDAYRATVEAAQQLDDQAVDDYWRMLDENTAGTKGWARKNRELIQQQYGTIDDILRRSFLDSHNVLANATNDFLDQLKSGQVDLLKSLEGLASGLSSVWTKALSDILMNGGGIWKQLKKLFSFKDQFDENGENADYLGIGMKGAGFGGMLGGFFQTPNNYASTGGAIGGGIGAAIGAYFGGPGGAMIGMTIGSMIGTAIGAAIKKNGNHIQIQISNATMDALSGTWSNDISVGDPGHHRRFDLGNGAFFDIDQQGLSMQAFNDLQVQVRRKVRQEMKSWQSILDLFPQEVRDALGSWKPTLTISGGVEGGMEIGDTTGLQQLNDFLSDKLPKAAFNAYEGGLKKAFETLGMGKERIKALFDRFGELQGQELQDAVKDWVVTTLEGLDWARKFRDESGMGAGGQVWIDAAKPQTLLAQLGGFDNQIAMAVASMSKLTDVDDILAAQKTINQLSRDRYEYEKQAIQQFFAQFKAMKEGNTNLKESIQVAGMSDQQKMDFFYGRLHEIYNKMAGSTDPEEIAKLNAQMQQYVQQALGLAPDNEENRTKLMQIIDAFNAMLGNREGAITAEMKSRDEVVANLLEQAAQALLKAAGDLSDTTKDDKNKDDKKDPNKDPKHPIEKDPNPGTTSTVATAAAEPAIITLMQSVADQAKASTIDQMRQLQDSIAAQMVIVQKQQADAAAAQVAAAVDATAIAKAISDALAKMEMRGTMDEVNVDVNTESLQQAACGYTVRFIRNNRSSIESRTA